MPAPSALLAVPALPAEPRAPGLAGASVPTRRRARGAVCLAGALALTLAAAGCKSGGSSTSISGVQSFPNLPHYHYLGVHLTYSHVPPVGGAHSPAWLNCGVYSTPVPNENAVHDLEHGAVWITYQPTLSATDVQILQANATINRAKTLISPYPGLPTPVVVTAWGLQMTASDVNDPRIAQFVKAYAGGAQGGEPGASCSGGVNPDQALQLLSAGPPATQGAPLTPADQPVAGATPGATPPASFSASPGAPAAPTPPTPAAATTAPPAAPAVTPAPSASAATANIPAGPAPTYAVTSPSPS